MTGHERLLLRNDPWSGAALVAMETRVSPRPREVCGRPELGALVTGVQIFFKVFGKFLHLLKTMSKFTLFYILQTKIFLEN